MSARSSAGVCRLGSMCAQEWWAISCPASRMDAVSAGNDSTVWPGTKKVASSLRSSRKRRIRGTPTRAPYSPLFSIAGVTRS